MTQTKNKYAVVDLEATSPGSMAKIIQVGIVIIEDGQITQTYETDVNPYEPLDSHIRELTGLTDERLAQAPDFAQVAREIYDLVADCIFVAHNVKFDADLLAEALFWEGFELITPRVDTVELAQIFYPTFEKYNLGILAERLGLDLDHAHTALSDAVATAQLFLKIQEKIKTLPKPLVEQILDLSDHLLYESRLAIEDAFAQMSDFSGADLQEVQGLFVRKKVAQPSPRMLSQDFATNLSLLGLDVRKKQGKFAAFVEQALAEDKPTFLQAQTGLGKTYAYLLPILAQTDQKVLVSVPTKLLQDQLIANEGQAIADLFQVSFHNLKGPDNYLKLDKFYQLLQRQDDNRMLNRFKMLLLVWLTETVSGDLAEIGQLQRYENFLVDVRHDGDLPKSSLFYGEDFWQLGQEKAQSARVLVTNHAYLLTRLEDDKSLAEGRVLVVDEAQKLLTALESFSRLRLNLNKLLQELHQENQCVTSILEQRLLESIQFELMSLLEDYHLVGEQGLQVEKVEQLRQDVSELDLPVLEDLQKALSARFSSWWLEEERFDHHRVVWLHASRPDLLTFDQFLPQDLQLLMVSATLDISSRVSLADLLGFETYAFHSIEAEKNPAQMIYVDQDFPAVTTLTLQDYAQLVADRIERLAVLERPMLVLFTAKDLLYEVSDRLQLPHLAQGKNGESFGLKKRFEKGETGILLGTGSFWEGVDFVHADQLIEVVTRLPFDNPKDPFVEKLSQTLRKAGKNPFYDYSLPVMLLKLRQALGRVQRRENQRSAVLILDNRVLTKKYSSYIKKSLAQVASLKWADMEQIQTEMKEFFEK